MKDRAITYIDVEQARTRLQGRIVHTPLLPAPGLSAICGREIYIKCENLQTTSSFKLRGATNKILSLTEKATGIAGVITASSGNHGQAVAYAAREANLPCTVVVPQTVIPVKEQAILSYGARVIRCGTMSNERIELAERMAKEESLVFVPPYDDPDVAAGQGTVGLEILDALPSTAAVFVPVGGGGLISGIATAIKGRNPQVRVIGVEPETANDTFLSFKSGHITEIPGTDTLADGLRTSHPGNYTFPIVRQRVDEIVLVSEDAIVEAFKLLLGQSKLLVEPSGCVSVAAALRYGIDGVGPVVCVLSGGNVDIRWMAQVLS